jgi:hypothetical protein
MDNRRIESRIVSETIFWGGHPEAHLAAFQKAQGQTNHCGVYAVSAAISLLRGGERIDYDESVAIADRHAALSLLGIARLVAGRNLRLWPGGPTTPRQQAHLAERLGRLHGLAISARAYTGTPNDLIGYLRETDTLVLVTIGWDDGSRPLIVSPDGRLLRFAPVESLSLFSVTFRAPFGGHVMVLAAHDPARRFRFRGGRTITAPWGFINSWADGADSEAPGHGHLYWMPDEDFRAAWGYPIWVGRNKMVVVTWHSPTK